MKPQPPSQAPEPPRPLRSDRQIEEQRQRTLIVNVMRGLFIVLLAIVTSLAIVRGSTQTGVELAGWWWIALIAVLVFAALVVGVDLLTAERKLSTIASILFGAFAGLLATVIASLVIDYFVEILDVGAPEKLVLSTKVILGLGLCYIGITTVLQTQDDFRLVIPYVEFAKQYRGTKPLLLDTSALIDGRIMDVAEVGCFQAPIIVPRFVIDELQTLADSSDKLKRARGRRGLELLSRMQRSAMLDVSIDDTRAPGAGVDQMIVELAQSMPAVVVTTDVGLNHVAAIHGVSILNLNELANALKPTVVPGETLTIELIKPGEQPGQGVGYLEDGTMVVVENGGAAIGRAVTTTVTSAMQTSAGRLIFGKLPPEEAGAPGEEPAPASDSRQEPTTGGDDPEAVGEPEAPVEAGGPPQSGPIGPQRKKMPGTARNPRRS